MQKLELATLLAFFAVVSPSLANSDGDRLREAGLLGSWAVDCNAPPSKTNPVAALPFDQSRLSDRSFYSSHFWPFAEHSSRREVHATITSDPTGIGQSSDRGESRVFLNVGYWPKADI